jgi:hypothetical protein
VLPPWRRVPYVSALELAGSRYKKILELHSLPRRKGLSPFLDQGSRTSLVTSSSTSCSAARATYCRSSATSGSRIWEQRLGPEPVRSHCGGIWDRRTRG